jgi:hypothetical protein
MAAKGSVGMRAILLIGRATEIDARRPAGKNSVPCLKSGKEGLLYNHIPNQRKGDHMVTTTETAQKRIAELLKEKKDVPQAVRVYLQEGG